MFIVCMYVYICVYVCMCVYAHVFVSLPEAGPFVWGRGVLVVGRVRSVVVEDKDRLAQMRVTDVVPRLGVQNLSNKD